MTRAEVIQSLHACTHVNNEGCRNCPLNDASLGATCLDKLMLAVLDLLGESEEENGTVT